MNQKENSEVIIYDINGQVIGTLNDGQLLIDNVDIDEYEITDE